MILTKDNCVVLSRDLTDRSEVFLRIEGIHEDVYFTGDCSTEELISVMHNDKNWRDCITLSVNNEGEHVASFE